MFDASRAKCLVLSTKITSGLKFVIKFLNFLLELNQFLIFLLGNPSAKSESNTSLVCTAYFSRFFANSFR